MFSGWEEFQEFQRAIASLIDDPAIPPGIMDPLRYMAASGGKRSRPILVLVCGRLCGGSPRDVMNLALATELIHTASLVHDDVIDGGTVRRSAEVLNVRYDTSLAILLGDWLISKSVELVSSYPRDVIHDFARVGMTMVYGEFRDLRSIPEKIGVADYYRCIDEKTADLFAMSARNTCRIVCGDGEKAEALHTFGRHLGLAYQLVDDLLEFQEMHREKKSVFESRTLPRIYEERFGAGEAESRCLKEIRDHAAAGIDALRIFPPTLERKKLEEMMSYLTDGLVSRRGIRRFLHPHLPIPK
jgi:octaprenyl-diphosphate synthase